MKNIKLKKSLGYLSDINEEKSKVAWQLNFGVMLIVLLSISVVGVISFKMISTSILNNAKHSSIQLVKQTSKILRQYYPIWMTCLYNIKR